MMQLEVVCIKEFFNCIFSNYKITPSSSKGENKINKVIILDTQKKLQNKPNAGKSGQGVALWVKVTQEP